MRVSGLYTQASLCLGLVFLNTVSLLLIARQVVSGLGLALFYACLTKQIY
jgi:hypothetical protein